MFQSFRRSTSLALVLSCAHGLVHADPYSYSRSSGFSYYSAADGAANGLLKTETIEPNNAQVCAATTYTYDAYGNKSAASTANCGGATGRSLFPTRSQSTTYGAQTTIVGGASVTTPAGVFATSAQNALNQGETHVFDPRFGAATQLQGPNGLTTQWMLDDFGRQTKQINADGTKSYTWYCLIGNTGVDTSSNSVIDGTACPSPASSEVPADAASFTHVQAYDANGSPSGPFVRVYLDRLGRQLRSVTQGFDGAGQPAAQSGGLVAVDTVYNALGMAVMKTQPYFLSSRSSTIGGSGDVGVTQTVYDALGRAVTTYQTDAAGHGGSVSMGSFGSRTVSVTTVSYNGLAVTTTDDLGRPRRQESDVGGRVARTTDPSGAQIAFQYDAFDNLVATKDPLGNQVLVTFDTRGRRTQLADPDKGTTSYDYDALGELVWQQTANEAAAGTSTTIAYDALGRMVRRVDPEYTTTWTFDKYADGSACPTGIGKLCETQTTNGIDRRLVYDALGRPVSRRTTVTSGPSFASSVSYDAATGRVSGEVYPTGLQVSYGYTAKGYLEKVLLGTQLTVNPLPATVGGAPGASTTLSANTVLWQAQMVDAWAKAESQTDANGVTTTSTFDPGTGRGTDMLAKNAAGTALVQEHYTWDSMNHLTARADSVGDGSGAVTETFQYGDQVDRLTGYTVSGPGVQSLSRTVTLQYNALGMLLYKSDVGNYTYNAAGGARPHAVQSVTGAISGAYGYDADGNVVTATGGKYSTISYTSFDLPDSQGGVHGAAANYAWMYDENHARIKEVETTGANTRTQWYLHPDNQGGLAFESEIDSSPALQTNRHFIAAGGTTVAVIASTGALPALAATQTAPTPLSTLVVDKVEFWHQDGLGNLAATSDQAGAPTAHYAYDPFGKRRYTGGNYDALGSIQVDWNPATNNGTPRGFTGHEGLDNIGLVHMNGRLYDPTLGVFVQADPMVQDPTNLQNYNRYGYCYNSPLGCADPTGYCAFGCFWQPNRAFKDLMDVQRSLPGQKIVDHYVLTHQWAYLVGETAASWYGGAVGAAYWQSYYTYQQTGSVGKAERAGAISLAESEAFYLVGTYVPAGSEPYWNIAAHAAVGCGAAALSHQSCGRGAASAAAGAAWSNLAPPSYVNLATTMIVGGTTSVIGGGKFANGAETAAMGYIFNYCAPGHGNSCGWQSLKALLQDSPLGQAWYAVFGNPNAPVNEVNTYILYSVQGSAAVGAGVTLQGGLAYTPGQDLALFGTYGSLRGFDFGLGAAWGYNEGPLANFQGNSTAVNAGLGILETGPGLSYSIVDGRYSGASLSLGFRGVPAVGATFSVAPNLTTCTISLFGKTPAGCGGK
jgi:RHS repeat-associated protein